MDTITVPKTKYRILEQQASLYNTILRGLEENFFPIEEYSASRMQELLKEDTVNSKTRAKVLKTLNRS